MAKIALRAYHREIEGLVESNQSEEALAHCRYILQSFPKYLETYRLLGKAFLENQRYGEASDVFQRVLSSMADDFVSHVGMSIIREDEGNMDAAIWHMERAFEVQPYNSAIQGELRRLYGRRDGLEPSKVRLTRGALARMYIKGGLYHQAIAELRAALSEDPQRPDLQLLLANAYFQAGQRVEAVEASSSLLKKLPHCFEANRILGCILPDTDRASDADIYRQRVVSLDPYFINLKLNTPTSEDVPDQAVVMDRLVWQIGQSTASTDSGQPTWARNLGVSFQDQESLPDWLTSQGEETTPEPVSVEPASPFTWDEVTEESAASVEMSQEELPGWMKEAGWGPSSGEVNEGPVNFDEPVETSTQGSEGELAPADIPDWLKDIAPHEMVQQPFDSATNLPKKDEAVSWLQETPSDSGDTIASWLQELGGEAGPSATPTLTPAQPADVPDWLQDLAPSQMGENAPSEMQIEAAEIPDWMQSLAPAQETSLPSEEIESIAAEMPDWLKDMAPQAETASAVVSDHEEKPSLEMNGAEMPEWLQSVAAEESIPAVSAAAEAAQPAEEMPEWLKSLQPTEVALPEASPEEEAAAFDWLAGLESATVTTEPVAAQPAPAEEATPDWLIQAETEAPESAEVQAAAPESTAPKIPDLSDEAAAMAWLESLAAKQGVSEEELFTKPEERFETPPAWVQAESAIAVTEAPTEAELPAWLSEVKLETPEAAIPQFEEPVVETQPTQETPTEEFPDWLLEVQAEIPADAVGQPKSEVPLVTTEEMPDWLASTQVSGEQPSGVTGFLESISPKKPGQEETEQGLQQGVPDLSDEAAAMAWLESLAAKQGVSEEELFTKPEERFETPPAWVQAESAEQPVALPEEQAAPSESLPDWLQEIAIEADIPSEAVEAAAATPAIIFEEEEPVELFVEKAEFAPAEELPAWLAEAETPTEAAALAPAAEASIPEIPDFSDEAAAMAWLEGLAAKQGVSEDELFTKPEERFETPPAWVEKDAAQAAADTLAAAEQPAEELPAWPAAVETEAPAEAEIPVEVELPISEELPAWLAEAETPTEAAEASIPEIPDFSDEAAAMAWLEGLAAKQGVSEDELFTKPEDRFETPPAWVEKDAAQAAADTLAAAEQPAEELPAWLAAIETEAPQETRKLAPAEIPAAEITTLAAEEELPAWLTAVEEELAEEAISAEAKAEVPDWQKATQMTSRQELAEAMAQTPPPPIVEPTIPETPEPELDANEASMVELEALPGIGFILAQNIINYRETYGSFTSLDDLQKVSGVGPGTVDDLRQWLRVAPVKAATNKRAGMTIPVGGVLEEARVHLSQDDPNKAAQIYSQLLHTGYPVWEIISDLQNALYRYSVDISLWQTLGEAFLLNDQLQEALDAYTKAEELLR